ncbi:MAG: hydroxymethylglutaryl-CoA lyase [Thermonemataceae bacterium]|nr:hydroxymethylglutaryl-CoA lyase [Thermonemataceae bacterium]
MSVKIIECPRDAMQGIVEFIPTELKVQYLNLLLQVGFDTLDFGSFVSPKAIPQMQDTAQVLEKLDLSLSSTKLLAIIANLKGAEQAKHFEQISYLGFPLSVSEEFQQRNTHKSIEDSLANVAEIQEICEKTNKTQVVYLSMAFGNPYGESYQPEIVLVWAKKLQNLGVKILALSDTIGVAKDEDITQLFTFLSKEIPEIEWGLHLHSNPHTAASKIKAAYEAGCRRFDGALRGFGGCPMAKDELTGNIATETILAVLAEQNVKLNFNKIFFEEALSLSNKIFH